MFETTCIISMDKEGTWFYNGSAVTNKNIALYFARHIDKDDGGGYVLRTERQVWPIVVEDTPYIIKKIINVKKLNNSIKVILNDDSTEIIAWEDIWLDGESTLYCRVKGRQFEARFNRNSQFGLADLLSYDEEAGRFYLEKGGKKSYLATSAKGRMQNARAKGFDR